jgi:dynein heavy chain, axonemal
VIKEPEDIARNLVQYWPCKELDFWASRSMELDAILMQLRSPKCCNVIQALRLSNSTYCQPLSRAIEEVTDAGLEARSNTTYLETMRRYLELMEDTFQPFEELETTSEADTSNPDYTSATEQAEQGIWQPRCGSLLPQNWPDLLQTSMHLLYLISKHSPYYNTSNRIGFFVRLVENLIIHRARAYVYNGCGNEVFIDFSAEASRRLEIAIQACSTFKHIYLTYETRSYQEFEQNGLDSKESPWARPPTGYFVRLEQFIERCQDVLHLAQSASTFLVLERIEFGGAHGHKSTARARSLYEDMRGCIQQLTQVEYSLLLVEQTSPFGRDFNSFCSGLKALEMRALSFLQVAYEECHNLESVSDLILSLEKVLRVDTFRPLLAKMLARALEFYRAQVEATRGAFISQQATKSRTIADNLPAVTAKLFWVKALMDRLVALDRKLCSLHSVLQPTEIENFQEALDDGAKLRSAMRNFDKVTYFAWVNKVQQLPEQVLNQPLIAKCEPHQQFGAPHRKVETIQINFPESVLEHFREAKYLKQLGYKLPETAHYLFERSEKIRAYLAHFKLIVDQYNELYSMSMEVEWPLLFPTLHGVQQCVQDAAESITWKSNRIDDVIVKISCELQGSRAIMDRLKQNRGEIMRILDEWGQRPLFSRRKTQSYSLSAFDSLQSTTVQARYMVIRDGALRLQSILEDSMAVSANNWTIPHWVDYATHIRKLCADWLTVFVRQNLTRLAEEVTCLSLSEHTANAEEKTDDMSAVHALLDITIELLHGATAEFVPPITPLSNGRNDAVKTSVFYWRDSILNAVAHATHDVHSVDYMPQIYADDQITSLRKTVSDCVDRTAQACAEYKALYIDYHFLWLEAGEENFQRTIRRKILTGNNYMPNMQALSEIVLHLLDLRERLASFKDFQRIAWIRVDARPLKSAIATLLSARLDRHIVFLQDLLANHLDRVKAFLTFTAHQLTRANDLRTGSEYMLVLVLQALYSIKQEREHLESTMENMEQIAHFLRGHGYKIDASRETQLSNTFQEWTDLQKFALHVKDKYSSLISAEFDRLRQRVHTLQTECQTAKTEIWASKIWLSHNSDEMSYDLIHAQHEQICGLMRDQTEVYELESLLELSKPMPDSMPVINECFLQIFGAKKLWDVNDLVTHNLAAWNSMRWSDVRVDELLTATRELMIMLTQVPQSPDKNIEDVLEKYVCNSELYRSIEQSLQFVLESLPIAAELQNSVVRPRHINKLMSLSGLAFNLDENVTLQHILSQRLPSFVDDIQTLMAVAEKEFAIEVAIESLQERWALQDVVILKHTDAEEKILAGEMKGVASNIQELETELTHLLHNKFGEVFREKGSQLQETFEMAAEFIECMMGVQSLWLTLFGLIQYDCTGLLEMLPEFKPAFACADSSLRRLLGKVVSYETVKDMMPLICDTRARKTFFTVSKTPQVIRDELEGCKKLLCTWLDQRRRMYPRLYLLSDEEMIKVLSQGMQTPRKLGKFLPRILHGVHVLEFSTSVQSTGHEVTAIRNKLGEHLSLDGHIKFRVQETPLENWFQELETRISKALKVGVMDGVRKMSTNRLAHWAVETCLQIVLLCFRVQWTGLVERALDITDYEESIKALQDLQASCQDNVAKVAQYLRNIKLDPLKRTKYSIIAAYESWGVDSIGYLVSERKGKGSSYNIDSAHMFEWQIQVRYYLRAAETEEDSSCRMRIGDSALDYGFELMGLKEPFCFGITSTKSFLALAMVMQHRFLAFFGSSLSATPCMGKTEMFKQFAIAAGQQHNVFTCTPHLSRKTITASVLGMSQCGSLGLWENFDKVPSDLICFTAALVKSVMNALRGGRQADVDGLNVMPRTQFGLHLSFTYRASGRVELPHDLRVLVRPVSVLPPDFNALAQLLLISQGFADYAMLSTKICAHLFLCRTMLGFREPMQDPWWSLTSIRTIIRTAGVNKICTSDVSRNPSSATSVIAESFSRADSAMSTHGQHQDMASDITLLVNQIVNYNRAIIMPGQEHTLKLITKTVFGTDQASSTSESAPISGSIEWGKQLNEAKLHEGLLESISERGLQTRADFLAKIVQLREILTVRFSTYIVGAPGVGKSEVWRALAAAERRENKVVVHTINPNALELNHLCGSYDKRTMEWRDGALCHMIRNSEYQSHVQSVSTFTWIVLDGEVQAEWLELLSPSFDGPHQLALDSGEVLQFDNDARILMETLSLTHAMPAAAARSGVLYMSDNVVSVDNIVSSWLSNLQRDSVKVEIEHQVSKKLPLLLEFINNSPTIEFFATVSCRACCRSMLRILDGLISAEDNDWTPENRAQKCLWMFDFAAVWGFGGAIAVDKVLDCRRIFSAWWRQHVGSFGGHDLPVFGTVFDYTFHPSTLEMCAWKDLVSTTKYFARTARDDIMVSSPTSVSIHRLLEATTRTGQGLLVVGGYGVGKTSIMQEFIRGLSINYLHRRICLHRHSTGIDVQKQVKKYLHKKVGRVYGPSGDKTLLVFIDDMAQPQADVARGYVRSSAAVIHQHIEHAVWYDHENPRACQVRNLQYVAAMLPSRGHDAVDARLLNKFSIVTAPEPDGHAIACIVTSLMASFMHSFEPQVKAAGQILGPLISDVHSRLAQHFASPKYPPHYRFSLHNVRTVLNSVCRVNPELYTSPVVFVSLLIYELHREYCDRMVKIEDVHIFKSIVKDGINKHLDCGMAEDPQLFGIAHVADFESGTVSPSRISQKQWCELVAERLSQHNESNPPIEMVIWDRVVEQVVRISRVLKSPKRCLILLGQCGTGRQSLVRLASYCCQAHFVHHLSSPSSTAVTHDELASTMKHELVSAMTTAGLSGDAVCFFLKQSDVSNCRLLVFIHQIFQVCTDSGKLDAMWTF